MVPSLHASPASEHSPWRAEELAAAQTGTLSPRFLTPFLLQLERNHIACGHIAPSDPVLLRSPLQPPSLPFCPFAKRVSTSGPLHLLFFP